MKDQKPVVALAICCGVLLLISFSGDMRSGWGCIFGIGC
jgi:hypothetical protein